ncbi:MAG: hypothetical protein HZB31_09110 [Nitrospirae bacterium]|nr:hypothetical protein [Nitrospirota bacterium]
MKRIISVSIIQALLVFLLLLSLFGASLVFSDVMQRAAKNSHGSASCNASAV